MSIVSWNEREGGPDKGTLCCGASAVSSSTGWSGSAVQSMIGEGEGGESSAKNKKLVVIFDR